MSGVYTVWSCRCYFANRLTAIIIYTTN